MMPGEGAYRDVSDIFISYNREDMAVAQRFAEGLSAEGLAVWWDQTLRAGETYDEVTEAALRGAKAVVVLWSPRSVASRWVRAEATLADRAKTLLPVMIEPCERPIMFELTQTTDLTGWTGNRADPAWQRLVHDVRAFVLRHGGVAPPASAPVTAPVETRQHQSRRGEAPSLAVMPFTNRSGLAEDEVFALGMVEDLIDALSEGVHVRVIASSATARFRNAPVLDLHEMGQQLGVRYVLEGNVRRSGDVLRVTAQLVETKSGEIVWNQKFERPVAELATLQEELISEVAAHLGANIYRLEMERALRKPSDLTAWECTARAMAAMRGIGEGSLQTAIAEAARAIEIAPDYALAYAALAQFRGGAYNLLCFEDDGQLAELEGLIDKALALDHDSVNVQTSLAGAYYFIERNAEAVSFAERALRQRPGNGLAHLYAAMALSLLDRHSESRRHFADFLRLEPDSHLHYNTYGFRGMGYAREGDFANARADFARSFAVAPQNFAARMILAGIEWIEGNRDEAARQLATARADDSMQSLAVYRGRMGRYFKNSPQREAMIAAMDSLWD